jgi:hypothetical protein
MKQNRYSKNRARAAACIINNALEVGISTDKAEFETEREGLTKI